MRGLPFAKMSPVRESDMSVSVQEPSFGEELQGFCTVGRKAPLRFRHELKHVANEAEADMLAQRLALVLPRDAHAGSGGRYRVTSLYFETPYDKALRQKLEGIDRREKFRLRYYGSDTSLVKLERKIKANGLCAKQSARLDAAQVRMLLSGSHRFLLDCGDPLCVELYAKMQGELLRPRVVVRYEREAFSSPHGNVRVTIDRSLRTSLSAVDFLEPHAGRVPAADGQAVVEVKYDAYLPDVVRMAVQPLARSAAAYSKYALCRRFD